MVEQGVISTTGAWLTAHLEQDMGFGNNNSEEEGTASDLGLDTSTGGNIGECCFQQRQDLQGGEAVYMAMG